MKRKSSIIIRVENSLWNKLSKKLFFRKRYIIGRLRNRGAEGLDAPANIVCNKMNHIFPLIVEMCFVVVCYHIVSVYMVVKYVQNAKPTLF